LKVRSQLTDELKREGRDVPWQLKLKITELEDELKSQGSKEKEIDPLKYMVDDSFIEQRGLLMKCAQGSRHMQSLLAALDQDCFGDKGGFDKALSVDSEVKRKACQQSSVCQSNDGVGGTDRDIIARACHQPSVQKKSKVSWFEHILKNVDPSLLLVVISIMAGTVVLVLSEVLDNVEEGGL